MSTQVSLSLVIHINITDLSLMGIILNKINEIENKV